LNRLIFGVKITHFLNKSALLFNFPVILWQLNTKQSTYGKCTLSIFILPLLIVLWSFSWKLMKKKCQPSFIFWEHPHSKKLSCHRSWIQINFCLKENNNAHLCKWKNLCARFLQTLKSPNPKGDQVDLYLFW